MSKCEFNKVAKQLLNLLHIFRTPLLRNTSDRLLLNLATYKLEEFFTYVLSTHHCFGICLTCAESGLS